MDPGDSSVGGGQHGGDGGGGGKDARGGGADLLRGECLIGGGEAAVFVGRVAEKQVERDLAGDVGGGLLLDGEAAEHGGADALERCVRDSGGGDFSDFGEQFAAGELRLLGGGGEVEGEEPGVVAEELGGTDLIGESEFLADAGEERACHVRGVLLDHCEFVTVRTGDSGAGEADGEHRLFFWQADGEVVATAGKSGGTGDGAPAGRAARFPAIQSSVAEGSKSPAMASVRLAALKCLA